MQQEISSSDGQDKPPNTNRNRNILIGAVVGVLILAAIVAIFTITNGTASQVRRLAQNAAIEDCEDDYRVCEYVELVDTLDYPPEYSEELITTCSVLKLRADGQTVYAKVIVILWKAGTPLDDDVSVWSLDDTYRPCV